MEATTVRSAPGWTFAQKGVVAVSAALTIWNVAGLLANPDFSTGDSATAVQVLGVDFNGWHALSGFLLILPGFYFALRPKWAIWFALYAAGALIFSAIYALFSTRPADLLAFPHNEADAALHFSFAAAYLVVAGVQIARDRAGPG